MRAHLFAVTVALAALVPSCGPPPPAAPVVARAQARWVVIAPHPDDETLIGSGVLFRAVEAHEPVAVIVMTNGDFDCDHDGLVREGESIRGLAALGVPAESVYFLGYPDGGLGRLGLEPLPPQKRNIDGACTAGNTTYGKYGFHTTDYHRARAGTAALYTRENAVADLAALLGALAPEDVVVTHPEDTHPDHAATYALFRAALNRLPVAPRVHRALVHNGDCWPMSGKAHEPCPDLPIDPRVPTPPLTGRLTGYVARERLPVPAACLVPDPARNPKVRAIAAHASQTRGSWDSYLFSFARSDEMFFPERFERHAGAWRRTDSGVDGATTTLDLVDGERHLVAATLPLVVAASVARPRTTLALEVLGDDTGTYRLELDPDRVEARLYRGPAPPLKAWPLPHDLWRSGGAEAFELRIEARPDDGGVAEIGLACRGEMVGVAVDVAPRLRGDWLKLSGEARGLERVIVRAPPRNGR